MVKFKEVKAKTVLNKYKYRDNWFWCRYSVNPYRGCQFACNYCDAITEKYLFYKNIEELKESICTIRNKNALEKISGVGKNLAETIREYLDTGKSEKLERLKTKW